MDHPPLDHIEYHNIADTLYPDIYRDDNSPDSEMQLLYYNAIMNLIKYNKIDEFMAFLDTIATEINSIYYRCSLLHKASEYGNIEIIAEMISRGADIHIRDLDGGTILHRAVLGTNEETIIFLLERGMDLNVKSTIDGNTPLHIASFWKNADIVNFLIENGADINCMNDSNETPVNYLINNLNLNLLQVSHSYLLSNTNNLNNLSESAINLINTLNIFIAKGADFNVYTKRPFHTPEEAMLAREIFAMMGAKQEEYRFIGQSSNNNKLFSKNLVVLK
ncbi:MAG: ankyrin repeat domain-containing protein [Rickettsiaceae bacterium]|nr:ankyrin repeat domain-containing protein [Rickettsiaceae bacterium]